MRLLYILHQAHDLNIRLDVIAAAKCKMKAYGIASDKILLGHRFADDRHFRLAGTVTVSKLPPRQQRNAQSCEIARTNRVKVDVRIFAAKILAAFYRDVAPHVAARQRAQFRSAHGAHARNRGHSRA